MNKPKKVKNSKRNVDAQSLCDNSCNQGYNIACDDWETWLQEVVNVENIERVIEHTLMNDPKNEVTVFSSRLQKLLATKLHNLIK